MTDRAELLARLGIQGVRKKIFLRGNLSADEPMIRVFIGEEDEEVVLRTAKWSGPSELIHVAKRPHDGHPHAWVQTLEAIIFEL